MLYLNYFISAIVLSLIILISYYLKDKTIIYFVCILLIFLILNNILNKKKEYFTTNQIEVAAGEQLRQMAEKDRKLEDLQDKIKTNETNITDLIDIVKQQKVKELYKKNAKSRDFTMEKLQETQDKELDFLEREIDILTKLYQKEVDLTNNKMVSSIPVLSSCKVRNEGEQYKNTGEETDLINKLEKMERMKNTGISSDSSNNLYELVNNQKINDNIDINVNVD